MHLAHDVFCTRKDARVINRLEFDHIDFIINFVGMGFVWGIMMESTSRSNRFPVAATLMMALAGVNFYRQHLRVVQLEKKYRNALKIKQTLMAQEIEII